MFAEIKRKLYPDSLIKKCIYGILGMAVLMLFLITTLVNNLMFQLLKPTLRNNYAALTSAVSTKVSYILHANSQYVLKFWKDEELMKDVLAAAGQTGEADSRKEVLDRISGERIGETEAGAIISHRNLFLVVDQADCLAGREMEPYAGRVLESEWFERLPDILEKLSEAYEGGGLERCYSPVFPENGETEEFIAFAVLKYWDGHRIYLIMVEPFADFRNIFSDFMRAGVYDYCLLGYKDQVLFQSREESFMEKAPDLPETVFSSDGQYSARITEQGAYTVFSSRASYRMDQIRVAVGMNMQDFLEPYQPFIRAVMLLFFIFVVFFASLIVWILRRSLGRLKKLSFQMERVRAGEYQVEKKIESRDEVGRAAVAFYDMLEKIRHNMEQIQEQELKEKRIEYSLLLSQIDPHFIYNTLNTITYLAELKETDDIIVLNKALIGMLRDRLRMAKQQIFDALREEKAQIDSYMIIQGYLCRNKLQYQFHIPEDCLEFPYPKHVLQPFVENAILHGILLHKDEKGRPVPGRIQISVYREEGRIITEIEDNGIGMGEEQIAHYFEDEVRMAESRPETERDGGDHIGIYNIRLRLGYLYGERFCLKAERSKEGGLKIQMAFPTEALKERVE